jgi:hypothetical protein
VGCNSNVMGSQVHIWSRSQHTRNSGGVHPFTGGPCGLRIQETPHMKRDFIPITVFLLFFMEVIQLLVTETNKYYSQYLDTLDNDSTSSWSSDVAIQETYVLSVIIIQMGHDIGDTVKYYWSILENFYTPFHNIIMKSNWFFDIMRFLHFRNSMN